MILTCPACSTKYVVKDGAIPPEGRQVRCASCKHSWHQDAEGAPPTIATEEPAPAEPIDERPPAELDEQSFAEAAMIEPRSGPELEERAYEEASLAAASDPQPAAGGIEQPMEHEPAAAEPATSAAATAEPAGEWLAGAAQAEEFEPFYEPEPLEGRRRRMPVIVWLLLIVAVAAAAAWFFAPAEIRQKLGLADGGTPLEVMVTDSDRTKLESGNEYLNLRGRIINRTDEEQRVPVLLAQLQDPGGRVVYSWTIDPPAPSLGPGESASFVSAEVDVPQGGSQLKLMFGEAAKG